MQLRFFLLLLAIFASSCSAFSLSTVETFVQGRNLRGYKAEDEERALSLSRMTVEKLENILTNTDGIQLAKFAKWQSKDVPPLKVFQTIKTFSPHDERYYAIGLMYSDFLKGIKPMSTHLRLDESALAELSRRIANSKLEPLPSPTWTELFGSLTEALRKKAASYLPQTN
ncbi:hypothetical protein DVH05_026730 [Phytophthora capsici]|nr:hypothetical protein DVH05_026730 [Phytophthora capsici]